MVFSPIFFTVLAVLTGHRGNDLRQHVFGFRVNGAGNPTQAEITSLNAELWNRISSPLRALSCSDLNWEHIISTWMQVPNGTQATLTFGSPQQGTASGFSLPGNCAYALGWRTAQSGRSFRGRTYITNISENAVNGDSVTNGFLSDAGAFANAIIGNYVSNRFSFAVASRAFGGSTAITGLVLDPTMDSQRRRLAGRGQ